MKKLTKILSVIAILAILVVSLSVFVACDKANNTTPAEATPTEATPSNGGEGESTPGAGETEPTEVTFALVVRKYNGAENFVAKLDGEILGQKTITVADTDVTVSDALGKIAVNESGSHKIYFSDTDYIEFLDTTVNYTTSWFLSSGSFAAETRYTDKDFQWSYMAYNGHYSNGVTVDFVEGLTVYTIVIDGYDGNIGSV